MVKYMLRDGVTEGRIAQVMQCSIHEIETIRERMGRTYRQREAESDARRARRRVYAAAARVRNFEARQEIKKRVRERRHGGE